MSGPGRFWKKNKTAIIVSILLVVIISGASYYFIALAPFNIRYDKSGLDIFLNEAVEQKIKTKYNRFLKDDNNIRIGIAPGASFLTKRWTQEGFREVINYFVDL